MYIKVVYGLGRGRAGHTTAAKQKSFGEGQVKAMHLHVRNTFQVLGPNLDDPSDFVVCWTPDGAEKAEDTSEVTGGTGTAIRIASTYEIPVYNLRNKKSQHAVKEMLDALEEDG